MPHGRRVAVIGAGWAGLAAAVRACERGDEVEVFETAASPGGRARSVTRPDAVYDNGQHILIGAYTRTLSLMRTLGVDVERVLHRCPLSLTSPDGQGLALEPGPAVPAFVRAVLRQHGWTWPQRVQLLLAAARWRLGGFRCEPSATVADLVADLPTPVVDDLIDPLCVAALNTPMREASAQVFLQVLHDALFAGPGAADLLLPRMPMGALLPEPALRWLGARGVPVHLGRRVLSVDRAERGWSVAGRAFDAVVLCAGPRESARLARPHQPDWADRCEAMDYQPIVTVWLHSPGTRLQAPMHRLPSDALRRPAQFVLDLGQLWSTPDDSHEGKLAFVVSGAATWLERGLDATVEAVRAQAREALGARLATSVQTLHAAAEKRATFACRAGLVRPSSNIREALVAAGDHVDGPYPATLEGAVRSAEGALQTLDGPRR